MVLRTILAVTLDLRSRSCGKRRLFFARSRTTIPLASMHCTIKSPMLAQCMVRPCVAREFVDLVVSGLASMYPAFDWSVLLRAIMDISAPAISLADRPQVGHSGHQCSH